MTPRSSDRDAPPDAEPDRHVPRVLIVGGPDNIRWIWKTHLDQQGLEVHVAADEDAAIECLRRTDIDVIVLDVMLSHGVGFAVSDYAQFRRPDARVIFVTRDDFLSGGAIFQLSANACAAKGARRWRLAWRAPSPLADGASFWWKRIFLHPPCTGRSAIRPDGASAKF